MKHKSNLFSLYATLTAVVAVLTGCVKESEIERTIIGGDVEIAFTAGGLQIDPAEPPQPLAQSSLVRRVGTHGTGTRAEETGAAIAVDTTFRVVAFATNADVTAATPEAENTYRIANADGAVVTTAVKSSGEADKTEGSAPGALYLKRSTHDLYYFSPALPVTAGKVMSLTNGVDYMAVKQPAVDVQRTDADGKFHIGTVQFARLCSHLDIRVTPKSGDSFIKSITLDKGGAKIEGLAAEAQYTLGTTVPVGIGSGSISFTETDFTATDANTPGGDGTIRLTTEGKAGAIVLPLTGRNLTVTLDLRIDNTPVPVSVPLAGTTLASGCKYVLDLKVNRQGSPTFTVTVEPWDVGGSGNTSTTSFGIGAYRDGGIVFWINPEDMAHYKVVSADETTASWSDAGTWATNYGEDWRLPTPDELTALYNVRRNNGGETELQNSVVDKAITALQATPFGASAYWSSAADASNAQTVALDSGISGSAVKTDKLCARVVKEML